MLIINAGDWGRSVGETDAAFTCFRAGTLTSVSAMVFMRDSERAAAVAQELELDVGLHLNLSEPFTGKACCDKLVEQHNRIARFLNRDKYARLLYNPGPRQPFRYVFEAQYAEFLRLSGKGPSHIDGHHHLHLCTNMLLGGVIPTGERVRRNFSFQRGEKSFLNRAYRRWVDRCLMRRYRLTDHFFAHSHTLQYKSLPHVLHLARKSSFEMETHPAMPPEKMVLLSEKVSRNGLWDKQIPVLLTSSFLNLSNPFFFFVPKPQFMKEFENQLWRKRFLLLVELFKPLARPLRILDVGGSMEFWAVQDYHLLGDIQVTLLNLFKQHDLPPNFRSEIGDARRLERYRSDGYDVVLSNSVIGHVGSFAQQKIVAEEIRAVAPRYLVQTPNHYFPIDWRTLVPLFHFLPLRHQAWWLHHLPLAPFGRIPSYSHALKWAGAIRNLTYNEFRKLFPDAKIFKEKLFGFTKSFTACKGFDPRALQ
jgi:predicted glycoside hydrolase/deacetylase ChbG (UPF0249 family)